MTASTVQFWVVLIEITNLERSSIEAVCAFFQKDLNYEYNRILRSLYISLLSDSLIEKFHTLTKY